MKRNLADLMKLGVVVPALVISLAACGSSGNGGSAQPEDKPATEESGEPTPAAEESGEPEAVATEPMTYENGEFKLTVPAELVNKIRIDNPEHSDDGIIFSAWEIASVEADKATGHENEGGGWLFTICHRDEESAHRIMTGDMSGEEVMGVDENGTYYIYYHPTDVRYVRETPEQMEKDQEDWSKACEWAGSVRTTFFEENSGITPISWSNTELEAFLAKTCYSEEGINYTISTLEFGPLPPKDVDAEPYFKKMTTNVKYEAIDGEAPDGEYVVLMFADDDYRFDFFYGDKNVIRMVWNEGQNEQLFRATFEDGETTTTDIMDEWYSALAEANGMK